jgi:hypothetical protein
MTFLLANLVEARLRLKDKQMAYQLYVQEEVAYSRPS